MKRIKVESSSISSVGYDKSTRTLEVEFPRGAIFEYKCVPLEAAFDLIFAESIGKFFNTNIKNNYQFTQIGE